MIVNELTVKIAQAGILINNRVQEDDERRVERNALKRTNKNKKKSTIRHDELTGRVAALPICAKRAEEDAEEKTEEEETVEEDR